MNDDKQRTVLIAVVVGIIALLLGCLSGSLFGATIGYLAGTRAAEKPSVPSPEPFGPFREPEREQRQWSPEFGALIVGVLPNSPAEKAALKKGDMIIAIDGEPLSLNRTLADAIAARKPGESVRLTVMRGNDLRLEVIVRLESEPEGQEERPWLGIRYRMVPIGTGDQGD